MKKVIFTLLFIQFLFAASNAKDEAIATATDARHKLHDAIASKVNEKVLNSGLYDAAVFCVNDSYNNTKKLDESLGDNVSIKRVSLGNRNPNSYPQDDEKKILEAFALIESSSAYLPDQIVQVTDKGDYKVYFPATMSNKNCKLCHGVEANINKEVHSLFKEKYPNDKAYGFSSGEVRGAVVITIKHK
ncbi:MAG: DUF3365 domain-containing protein [Arcobacteraceae bacterium]|jgi:hypothetical protein|nr:DUF3365 domain-containing protein [Arcobacteraceae bacterium]MDY0365155.1 DUF3365 domain-containing protein [Arcobacteraceae bacterium]